MDTTAFPPTWRSALRRLGLAPRSPGCAINCPTISGMRAGAPEESRSSLFPRLRPNRIEDRAVKFTVTASRQEVVADDFVDGPRAGVGQAQKAGFGESSPAREQIGFRQILTGIGPQRRILLDHPGNAMPGFENRAAPTPALPFGLIFPFEQVKNQVFQSRFDLVLVAGSQGLNLLRQIVPVELVGRASSQRVGLLPRPLVEVGFVAHGFNLA